MKRFAWIGLAVLLSTAPGYAQQRMDPVGQRQFSSLSDPTQLQWFMLTNHGGLPVPSSTAAGSGGANGASASGSTVSVSTLQIPDAAMKEMLQFQTSFDAGKLEDSAKHLQKAIRIYPQWAAAHYNLGQTYARMHDYEKAVREFQAAATLDAHMAQPWVSLAALHFLQKEYPEGEEAARRALDIDPLHSEARYFLGRILAVEGHDLPEAIAMLEKSRDDYPAARLALANLYLKREAVNDALVELRGYLSQANAPEKEKVSCMVERLTQPAGTVNCVMQ